MEQNNQTISEKRFNTLKMLIEENAVNEKSDKKELKIIGQKFAEINFLTPHSTCKVF